MWHHVDTDNRFLQNNVTTATATATATATTTTATTNMNTTTASSPHLFLSGLRRFDLVQLHFHHLCGLTGKQFYQAAITS